MWQDRAGVGDIILPTSGHGACNDFRGQCGSEVFTRKGGKTLGTFGPCLNVGFPSGFDAFMGLGVQETHGPSFGGADGFGNLIFGPSDSGVLGDGRSHSGAG